MVINIWHIVKLTDTVDTIIMLLLSLCSVGHECRCVKRGAKIDRCETLFVRLFSLLYCHSPVDDVSKASDFKRFYLPVWQQTEQLEATFGATSNILDYKSPSQDLGFLCCLSMLTEIKNGGHAVKASLQG